MASKKVYSDLYIDGEIVGKKLSIDGEYSLPTVDGLVGQVLSTDGAGTVSFINISTLGLLNPSSILNGTGLTWTQVSPGILQGDVDLSPFSTSDLVEGTRLYFTNERVDDRVNALLLAGTGLTKAYNDGANSLTLGVTLSPFTTTDLAEGTRLYFTNERVDDRVAALIQNSASVTWTYNDSLNTLTASAVTTPLQIQEDGVVIGNRGTVDFITGSNSTLTVLDDALNNKVTVQIDSAVGSLDDLSDVTITSPSPGDILSYVGPDFQNIPNPTVIQLDSGLGSSVRILNSNTASGDYSTVSGGLLNTASAYNSTIGGGIGNTASGYESTVGGGNGNIASGSESTISGGIFNATSGDCSVISGGCSNTAGGVASAVGGGITNIATGDCSTVGGGQCNTASGYNSIVSGGYGNTSSGSYSSILGGRVNTVSSCYSTIGGGQHNETSSCNSTIGGGYCNCANDHFTTVAGGFCNGVGGLGAVIGGGLGNTTSSTESSTIGGGCGNVASSNSATVGGGKFNTSSNAGATVSGGFTNTSSGVGSVIGGGYCNTASGIYSSIVGGNFNSSGVSSAVGGGVCNSATGTGSTVGGGYLNSACGFQYGTVSGGYCNTASGEYDTVGGGACNLTGGNYSTISGGQSNSATACWSAIGGGFLNTSSGTYSVIGGGTGNTASACQSAVVGGTNNVSSGTDSFIGGGFQNTASGPNSSVLGGYCNTVTHDIAGAFGCNISSVCNNTFHTNYLNLYNTPESDTSNTASLVRDTATGQVKVRYQGGLFAQTSSSTPITGTVTETSLISTGVGTLTVPANGFTVGDSFSVSIGGVISSANGETVRIRLKAGSVLLADTTAVSLPALSNRFWSLQIQFTIRAIGAAGVASIAANGQFSFSSSGFDILGADLGGVESTNFDTTASNTLSVTAQWGSTNATNNIYSNIFIINKNY
jgi:hypothetical protein